MPLVYDPVIKNGLYEVSLQGITKRYRAVDVAEAKWKLSRFLKTAHNPANIACKVIEKTLRQSDMRKQAS